MKAIDLVVGVDQALDDTGIAVVVPLSVYANHPPGLVAFMKFLGDFLPIADERFHDRQDAVTEMLVRVADAIKNNAGPGSFALIPMGRKRKNSPFAFVDANQTLVFHFCLSNAVSQGAEYLLADLSAEKLSIMVRALAEAFPLNPPQVILEALALRGSMQSIQILPVLAVVFAAFMRSLHANSSIAMSMIGHINVGTWKLAFANKGNADKKEIKDLVVAQGAHPDISDDESDAIAIALCVSARHEKVLAGMIYGGRILPRKTQGESER